MTSTKAIQKKLLQRVYDFANASLSDSTKRAYAADWGTFHEFCDDHDLKDLPAESETVCLYLAHMADSGKKVSTIVRSLTSISAIHEASGNESPTKSSKVKTVLRGIKRQCGEPQERARPIFWADLQKMARQTDCLVFGCRDRAILLLGWTSALRRSELVALNACDLDFQDQGVIIQITKSKTDPEGTGRTIGIPRAENGFCPVRAVEQWIERAMIEPGSKTPLFPSLGKAHATKRAWFSEVKKRLSPRMISIIVKRYGKLAGLPTANLSAHSLRRGFASEAGARGIPERMISRHTGHRSLVVLRKYIEEGTIWEDNPLHSIYTPISCPVPGVK